MKGQSEVVNRNFEDYRKLPNFVLLMENTPEKIWRIKLARYRKYLNRESHILQAIPCSGEKIENDRVRACLEWHVFLKEHQLKGWRFILASFLRRNQIILESALVYNNDVHTVIDLCKSVE